MDLAFVTPSSEFLYLEPDMEAPPELIQKMKEMEDTIAALKNTLNAKYAEEDLFRAQQEEE